MKPITSAAISALVFAVAGWLAGISVGFSGFASSLFLGAAGSFFGLLIFTVGPKAFWLPAGGLLIGFALVLAAQLISPAAFEISYYIFVPLLVSLLLTPAVSIVLQIFPLLRSHIFGNKTRAAASKS